MNMKRYYILFLIAAILTLGCEKEKVDNGPTYHEVGTLEVSFVFNGSATRSISLTPMSQTIEVEAILNHDDIKWNVVSDSPWCIVDSEQIHEGSDTFTFSVAENDGYVDREPATLSLCAGRYKADLRVAQVGNAFIIEQVFAVGMKTSGSTEFSIKVQEGVNWDSVQPEWISVSRQEVQTNSGETEYKITAKWEANSSRSRLGTIDFVRDGDQVPSANFAIWQFGDEYATNDEGVVMVPSQTLEPIEIRTPSNILQTIECPEWVELEKVTNEDNTTSWMLYFAANPSDCERLRETRLSYIPFGSEAQLPLPVILQDFYPAGGLISAPGFAMFAQKFNAGEDVSAWVKDGKVNVLSHVDMSDLEGKWVSIGTEECPFDLEFNGDNRILSGFDASEPLFGVCDGAVIKNLTLDKSCNIVLGNEINKDLYLSALVGKAVNTTISGITSNASVTLDAPSVTDKVKLYVGGLVGHLDEKSSVTASANAGSVTATAKARSVDGNIYMAGVSAYTLGTVSDCYNSGNISDVSVVKYHYVGGLAGQTKPGAMIKDCSNSGKLTNGSLRKVDGINDINRDIHVGGVVGYNEGELTNSVNNGDIEVSSDVKTLNIGGVVGTMQGGTVEKLITTGGNISYKGYVEGTSAPAKARYVYMGGIIGQQNCDLTLNYAELMNSCNLSAVSVETDLCMGGIVGRTTAALTLKSPSWNGSMIYDISADATTPGYVGAGGLVGAAKGKKLSLEGAHTAGSITVKADNGKTYGGASAFGGMVGIASNGVDITNSENEASVKWSTNCGRTNGTISCSGGFVGRIDQGESSLSGCTNNADVHNRHFNNNAWEKGKLLADRTGGIVGCYGYLDDLSTLTTGITISDCHVTSEVISFRGLIGGIAGFLHNADVKGCTFNGKVPNKSEGADNYNCNVGGIAGGVENSSISNCKVVTSLYGVKAGSCGFKAGGIVAYLYSGSSVSDCKYFGHITTADNGTDVIYYGGIVGQTEEGCSVSKCGFGGSILGETITTANYMDFAIGNKAITPVDCAYWAGE